MSPLELDSIDFATTDSDLSPPALARAQPAQARVEHLPGAVTGVLVGFREHGRVPLVLFPGQSGSAAVAACSTVEVHGIHIGRQVVLVFEGSDATRPIIVGLLCSAEPRPVAEFSGRIDVDADGTRMTIEAKEQLVLRCGSASITLTKAGKVLIRGEYVSHASSGVFRIKGGSVQVN